MLNLFCCFTKKQLNNQINNQNPLKPNIKFNDTLLEIKTKLDQIKEEDKEKIKCFSFKDQIFYGYPTNIYDGDTFSLLFVYKNEVIKYRCRCTGYDSPEMKPSLSNPNRDNEKELAHKAKDRLIELLTKHETKMIKVKCGDFDKYGRLLIEMWNMVDEDSINEIMIKEGHGKIYNGGTKEKW
jgi:endonuclease YncB( thermonuclease family)